MINKLRRLEEAIRDGADDNKLRSLARKVKFMLETKSPNQDLVEGNAPKTDSKIEIPGECDPGSKIPPCRQQCYFSGSQKDEWHSYNDVASRMRWTKAGH